MNVPKIAPAEWEVMEVLWAAPSSSAAEVVAAFGETSEWRPKTIRTLLDRLVQKGAVARAKHAGTFRFSALVDRRDCVRVESRSFLERFFNGDIMPLMMHFIDERTITQAELEAVRKLLKEKAKENE